MSSEKMTKRSVRWKNLQPLFGTMESFIESPQALNSKPIRNANKDFQLATDFLHQYTGNQSTFNAYRREIERLLHWAWKIKALSILKLTNIDIETYIKFCQFPPRSWISNKRVSRFITEDGKNIPNPDWRPFVYTSQKNRSNQSKTQNKYQISQKTIAEIFVALGSFYNYLMLQGKIDKNPVKLIKQKSKFVQSAQGSRQVRRLSELQWDYLIETAEMMANEEPSKHERTLFIISAMYLMYLRISELGSNDRWVAQMNHFVQDSDRNWWFTTVGKGNKKRQIAVCSDMIKSLKRWRKYLKLPALPSPADSSPILPALRGGTALKSTRHIRSLVTECFNQTVESLKKDGFKNEAKNLKQASAHWLRHTGISDDINKRNRPLLHVRDDAGHSSLKTTEIYNDANLQERHYSARNKKLK